MKFHMELFDEKRREVVGSASFDLKKLFESSYGSATVPHYKQLSLPISLKESMKANKFHDMHDSDDAIESTSMKLELL